jgi:segregation and condensation protein A
LPAFAGPFDLLLHLIEKNKISLYDIPIAEMTAQYLEALRQFPEDMENRSAFLVMAATLLEIKSRML